MKMPGGMCARAIAQLLLISSCATTLRSAPEDDDWDGAFGVPGANGVVRSMAASGRDLYVGGFFSQIGGIDATNIVKWDGTNFSGLEPRLDSLGTDGSASSGYVGAILPVEKDVYVAWNFTK